MTVSHEGSMVGDAPSRDHSPDASNMVERVAKAIYYAENGIDGDCIGTMLYDNERVEAETAGATLAKTMDVCRLAARAAIEAMREVLRNPTEAMREAYSEAEEYNDHPVEHYPNPVRICAMLDAALTPSPTREEGEP